jgi:hypothetical protein
LSGPSSYVGAKRFLPLVTIPTETGTSRAFRQFFLFFFAWRIFGGAISRRTSAFTTRV